MQQVVYSSTHLCHLIRNPDFLGEEDWKVVQEHLARSPSGLGWVFGTSNQDEGTMNNVCFK